MRFMIIVKATDQTEAGKLPSKDMLDCMGKYHEELVRAGVLLDANGLRPSGEGFRIRYSGNSASLVDGPFSESKELIAGYTLIQVKSREEAIAWAKRFPNPYEADGEVEVRQVFELEDLGSGPEIDRMREHVFDKIG